MDLNLDCKYRRICGFDAGCSGNSYTCFDVSSEKTAANGLVYLVLDHKDLVVGVGAVDVVVTSWHEDRPVEGQSELRVPHPLRVYLL